MSWRIDVHESGLTGRVAVVTGAGTGLGKAIARALAEAGADLLLHYRSSTATLEGVAAECRALGRRVEIERADFAADPGLAAAVVDAAVERLGRIDILVNNAAVTTKMEAFEALSRELFEETLAVNLTAPFLATQAAARHMAAAGRGGRIINIGSVHARVSAPGAAAYESSKGGILALTAASAIGLGQHAITVNCVAPGMIVVERYDDFEWDEAWCIGRTPIGRNGRPEDIAGIVRFLAGDEASFITGETIYVDGGMTRRMSLVK
jgi:3-oxoacyl-[acyl-carrier protein] reductase